MGVLPSRLSVYHMCALRQTPGEGVGYPGIVVLMVVSCLVGLGPEPRSLARAASALNC